MNILLFSKDENKNETLACIINTKDALNDLSTFVKQNVSVCNLGTDSWTILSPIEQSIKNKMDAVGIQLKGWEINTNIGILTGYSEAFIIDGKKRAELIKQNPKSDEIIKPMLRGRDITKYNYDFADLWLLFIPWHFPLHNDTSITGPSDKAEKAFKKEYPAVYNHLLQHKKGLLNRSKAEVGIRYEWYAMHRCAANYWQEFYKPKIMWSDISTEPSFVYVDKDMFCNNTCYIMTNAPMYVLGILNSKIIKWYFPKIATDLGKGVRYFKQFVELLPIPEPNKKTEQQIEKLIEAKEYEAIDKVVYELYGLTEEEIGFIEGRN